MTHVEVIARAFILLCIVQAALSIFTAVTTNLRFLAYLKEHHYERWCEYLGEDFQTIFKHVYLTPMGSQKSYHHFIFKSQEDFGDTRVREFKRKIRWGAYGFLIGVIAFAMSLLISDVVEQR
jgi:hypothetical protein